MMPENPSLLAHLVLHYGEPAEVYATEGLGYLLITSEPCRQALATTLARLGVTVSSDLVYRTEDKDRESRPDVVGTDASSRKRLILEGKFWASLTDRQPISYLESLPREGALVVVAPSLRFSTLWTELLHRCSAASLSVTGEKASEQVRVARIDDQWFLALTTWDSILSSMHTELQQAGEQRIAGDIEQLASLCAEMDTSAFIPLSAKDIWQPSPRHVAQFVHMVDDLGAYGIERGVLSPTSANGGKFKVGHSKGRYIRYIGGGGLQLGIIFDLEYWSTLWNTPLWLEVAVPQGTRLQALEHEQPPRVYYEGYNYRPLVPLLLPLHAEKQAVIEGLLEQVRGVLDLVSENVAMVPRTSEPTSNPS
jgi:hypothetical protein